MRDDFSEPIKKILAARVGYKCSNPDCRRSTSGPHVQSDKFVSIGVAAHISAAAPGGPRYDSALTPAERKSAENGIWLCQNCAHIIDTDLRRWSKEVVSKWKLEAEAQAHSNIRGEAIPSQGGGGQASVIVLANEVDQLGLHLTDEVASKLEEMRSLWREGQSGLAFNWIKGLRQNETKWRVLSANLKAKLLRLEAALELDVNNDVTRAKILADQALKFEARETQVRLRSLIAYKETGPEAALLVLGNFNDVDSRNLRAGFLLERGLVEECRSILEIKDGAFEPNAETYRIRALAYLASKNVEQAKLESLKALELQPRWESVRFTDATIDYFSALAEVALPGCLVSWPEPVDWIFVQTDDESKNRLQKAAAVFQELGSMADKSKEERRALETWRLASLLNNPVEQQTANDYCIRVLKNDPAHSGIIPWAVTRNLELDLDATGKALRESLNSQNEKIPDILALASCYLASHRHDDAIKLLEKMKERFVSQKADDLWLFWYAQALVFHGHPELALAAVDGVTKTAGELRLPKLMALRGIAKQTGDWKELLDNLESSYGETKDPKFLLEICEIKAYLQDWAYVAAEAERLTAKIETSEVVRLGAIATFNARRFQESLDLLNKYRNRFPEAKLPNELRRLRVLCQQALGLLPQAVADAEMLATEEPTISNLTALARIYVEKGDLRNLAIVGRRLRGSNDLSAEDSLQFARLLHWEDSDLARQLWRQTVQKKIPNKLLGAAINVGYLLGLDNELGHLVKRMITLGKRGKARAKAATIKDLIHFVRTQRDHGAKLDKAYRDGSAPIHIIAEQANRPLVDFYHRMLQENAAASEPARRFSLLARHGGRPFTRGFPHDAPKWRLNLDITAVLLAEHVGILGDVEKLFKPVRISPALIPALIEMRDQMAAIQPSRLKAYREVLDLVSREALKIVDCHLPDGYNNKKLIQELGEEWVSLFEEARSKGGYVVDFLPVKKLDLSGPPTALPEDAGEHFATCRAILDTLRSQGPLSDEEYSLKLKKLGNDGDQAVSPVNLSQGAALFCEGNIPEVLADAEMLCVVCERFNVSMQKREVERLRGALREQERKNETATWISSLIRKLSDGVDAGIWQIISVPPLSSVKKVKQTSNMQSKCLLDLLQFELQREDVLWIDDRYVSSYSRRDQAAIIGIIDVLKALVGAKLLTPSEYFKKLLTLRAENVRFVPVEKDEILYHLQGAKLEHGELVETQSLAVLRRYISSCLLQLDILQWPPMPASTPNENGEVGFVITLGRAITDALVEIWKSVDKAEFECMARSEWLIDSLFHEHTGLNHPNVQQRSEKDYQYLVALRLSDLVTKAIELDFRKQKGKTSVRQRYFDWLLRRVLRRRFAGNPNLPSMLVKILEKTLLGREQEHAGEVDHKLETLILAEFFKDLPAPMFEEVLADGDLLSRLELKPQDTIYVEGLAFEASKFWNAVATAVNGNESIIKLLDEKSEIKVGPATGRIGQAAVNLNDPSTGRNIIFDDLSVSLALNSVVEREAALYKHKPSFDCPAEIFDQSVAKIVSIGDVERSIRELSFWRDSSAPAYYVKLQRQLLSKGKFESGDLVPPSVDGLLRHLRMFANVPEDQSFTLCIDESALNLLRDVGVQAAIERLWSLPVAIPNTIVVAVGELSKIDRRNLIKRLSKIATTPISQLHLLALIACCFEDSPTYRRFARGIVKKLLSPEWLSEFEAFKAILNWVSEEFGYSQQVCVLPARLRLVLVWLHAHKLYTIFRAVGAPSDWTRDCLSIMAAHLPHDLFQRDSAYWFDIAHPRHVSHKSLLFSGLSYALGEQTGEVFDSSIYSALTGEAHQIVDNVRIPALPLLKDPTLASNSLQSFLAGNRGETFLHLLGDEHAPAFSRETLLAVLQRSIVKLAEDPNDIAPWGQIFSIVGDMPPYEEIVEGLRVIVAKTEFSRLFEDNEQLSSYAMLTASTWVSNIGDGQLRKHLIEQLIEICKLGSRSRNQLAAEAHSSDSEKLAALLLESALNLSRAIQPPDEVHREFSQLVIRMVDAWPKMAAVFRPVVERVCDELPIAAARHLYPLLLRLRAC